MAQTPVVVVVYIFATPRQTTERCMQGKSTWYLFPDVLFGGNMRGALDKTKRKRLNQKQVARSNLQWHIFLPCVVSRLSGFTKGLCKLMGKLFW